MRLNDHSGRPNRRVRSAATHSASSLGIIVVIPPRSPILRWTAFTVACGECPAMEPVSPSAKSTYSWPSTSVIRFPCALSRYSG
ncbi:MAG: hypothetical protein V9G10_01750 [Candidatus Nanopelagicales bacterium]